MRRLLLLAGVAALVALGNAAPAADDKKDDAYAELIGKTAPDFATDFALNGKATKLSDLKGKVVLIDFWAVWCGPCIRTFPHLRDLNAKYKDQGLELLGVTTYYEKIGFDKEAGKVTQVKDKLTKVEEQAMLKDFATHHKLDYRLATIPADQKDDVYSKYKIRGIPTAVLVDRKGNLRLVKVGASEENGKEIEDTIKKLLAE